MVKTKEKLHSIKAAIKAAHRDYMSLERTKSDLLDWLCQLKFPAYPNASGWEDCITMYPDKDPDAPRPNEGIKLRFTLKLYTYEHRYLISIIECFDPDSSNVGIITVHMNWDEKEYNLQKTIETSYKQFFQDSIRAKQIIWAQSFYFDELYEALNCCAMAILSNELKGGIKETDKNIVQHSHPLKASFPEHE